MVESKGNCLGRTGEDLTQERLGQLLSDLRRFAEVSAHHLMEPARRLQMYSTTLRRKLRTPGTTLDPEVEDTLHFMEQDAQRLRSLLRDIQLYLAAGEARGMIRRESVTEALVEIKHRLSEQFSQTGAVLLSESLPEAVLDRPRLLDLLTILIENALIHGRPNKYGEIPVITVSGESAKGWSRYYIQDNGPGIGPEYLERVFGIFEKLGRAERSGTGIGLSIARRIIESRAGRIWMELPAEGGARVCFELPEVDE